MISRFMRSSLTRRILALVVLATVVSCGDDPMEAEEDEPEVATMRLVVGTQTVNVAENGTVTGGPITIGPGSTSISATFLKADGSVESIVTADVFQLNVASDNAAIASFTRSASFSGNLVGASSGQTTLRFSLFHIEEGHDDFGPFPVPVTVQ